MIVYNWLLTDDPFICDVIDSCCLLTCHNQSDGNLLPILSSDCYLYDVAYVVAADKHSNVTRIRRPVDRSREPNGRDAK